MWKAIKKYASKAWNWVKKTFKANFHKAVAVIGAGAVMCTLEILGIVAADYLLLPLAMVSIVGLIGLCFAYFLVIFASITIGTDVFSLLWDVCNIETWGQIVDEVKEQFNHQDNEPSNLDHVLANAAATAGCNA